MNIRSLNVRNLNIRRWSSGVVMLATVLLALSVGLAGQRTAGVVRGEVKDPSGAVVSQAVVSLRARNGEIRTQKTDHSGKYEFRNVSAGVYRLSIEVKGFSPYQKDSVKVNSDRATTVDASLAMAMEKASVTVTDESNKVDTQADNNASAVVIKGKALEALSDDPDELQTELTALAGPTAGTSGAQIYVDGFSGGELPPLSEIREIHINQDPFSAEYDKLGYGRIEILTKPGGEHLHGSAMGDLNSSVLNSRNPFVQTEPAYHRSFYDANLGGSFLKKGSFFVSVFRRDIQENSIINAIVLDPNFQPTNFTQAVKTPDTFTHFSPRIDYQLTQNNTVTFRYSLFKGGNINQGVGERALASQASNSNRTGNQFQISDTQILGLNAVDDTRFEYVRNRNTATPLNLTPTISVPGAFTDGGSSGGQSLDESSHYELQNYLSTTLGKHSSTFGVRIRENRDSNESTAGYNGDFVFNSINAYAITEQGLQQGLTGAQIRAAGGGPYQFRLTAGTPLMRVSMMEVGLFAADNWQLRRNLTLSYGLRAESQNQIQDHFDIAPRIGFAWGVRPGTVVRGGYGFFYDRFEEGNVLQALRQNGVTQQAYVVNLPDFYPNIPSVSALAGSQANPTIYRISPTLQAPLIQQGAIGVEQQLGKIATVSFTYLHSNGTHQLLSQNINAPLPGTYNPLIADSGVRPLGGNENIYQYESAGIFKQNQFITNFNVRAGHGLMLFGFYMHNDAHADTSGAGYFPSSPYNPMADYGRASFDVANRVVVGGSVPMPWGFTLNPFIVANSGQPFNITIGQDLNGDSQANDRPAFATDLSRPSVVKTAYGNFDTRPIAGQTIVPINYLTGPGQFSTNLALSHSFGFGPEAQGHRGGGGGGRGPRGGGGPGGGLGPGGLNGGGGGRGGFFGGGASDRRYQMTFTIRAHNIFNTVNLGTPVGVLSSPLFGQSTSLAGGFFSSQSSNRSIDMQLRFSF